MKVYETKTSPPKDYKVCVKRKCDLCGTESKDEDWGAGVYEINETEIRVTVRQKTGESYPEGGNGVECEIDLCPGCFKNRLIPWLRSQGAYIEEEKYYF